MMLRKPSKAQRRAALAELLAGLPEPAELPPECDMAEATTTSEIGVAKEAGPLADHGGDRRSEKSNGDQGSNRTLKRGTISTYLARRLLRDRPDLFERLEAGEFSSVRIDDKLSRIKNAPRGARRRPDPRSTRLPDSTATGDRRRKRGRPTMTTTERKTKADGLTWPDLDALTWNEADGLPWETLGTGRVVASQAYVPLPSASQAYTPRPAAGQAYTPAPAASQWF